MSSVAKWMSVSAVGVLLGLGLCGLDLALHPQNQYPFAGAISLLGYGLCVLSVVSLALSTLVMLGTAIRRALSKHK